MRVWIDPGRAAARGMTAGEVVAALRSQNVQVAAGTLGQPPYGNGAAFQLNVETQGRFKDPQDFANIIVKTAPDGAVTRVSDIGAGRARRRRLWRQRLSCRARNR